MPTIAVRPFADGPIMGHDLLVGASSPYLAVDDSTDGSHDGDASYIRLPKITTPEGIAAFELFHGAGWPPATNVRIGVAAKLDGALGQTLRIGLYSGSTVQYGADLVLTGIYQHAVRDWSVSPFSGLAWTPAELIDIYGYVENSIGLLGSSRLTLMYGIVTYSNRRYSRYSGRYREGPAVY